MTVSNDTEIADNLNRVRARVDEACHTWGRDRKDVKILAVSKTKPAHMIHAAADEGQADFGENYLQDALARIGELADRELTWHFIGAIQSNKTRDIANNFQWIHTVASEKVGRRLNDQAPAPINVLVQINVSGEGSKAGIMAAELPRLIETLLPMERLALRGLMAIPEPTANFEAQRQPFRRLRELLEGTRARFGDDLRDFDQLSMGMTADMEAAIAEGATWLRIGTAIFGPRTN